MRSRALIGKTIERVEQQRFTDTSSKSVWSLKCLQFTDGTALRFVTIEGDGDYGLMPVYPARLIEGAKGKEAAK